MTKTTDTQTSQLDAIPALPGPLSQAPPQFPPTEQHDDHVDPLMPGAAVGEPDGDGPNVAWVVQREFAGKTNAYILDYIKYGDAKAGAILTFAGLVGGGVATNASKVLSDAHQAGAWAQWSALVPLALVLVAAFAVGYYCLKALAPRTTTARSLASFPDIAGMRLTDYTARASAVATDEAAAREYLHHNWALSQVAQAKFDSIRQATGWIRWLLMAAVAFAASALLIATQAPSCVVHL